MPDYGAPTNTAEQAAAQNAAYLAGVPYLPGNYVSPQQDAANEQAKHDAAFSQPRTDVIPQSAAFVQINQQYQQQHSLAVGSGGTYNPNVGYANSQTQVFSGRAAEYAASWSPLTPSRYSSAPLPEQTSTVPIHDVSSNAPTRAEVLFPQTDYERQAVANAQLRPGYTPASDLGDRTTQAAATGIGMMRAAGFDVATPDLMIGRTLEYQRQAAFLTPGSTDDRYYSGELQKWAEDKVELSSSYHHVGMSAGVQIPANRWEYQSDLAVEFLKGEPRKDSERFSPVSGEMSANLPQFNGRGEGVQDYAWRLSEGGARGAGPVSFMAGVNYLGAAEGKYGPYGKLFGGPEYTAPVESKQIYSTTSVLGRGPDVKVDAVADVGIGLPRPFISTSVSGSSVAAPAPSFTDTLFGNVRSSIRTAITALPGTGVATGIGFDTVVAAASGRVSEIPFYDAVKAVATPFVQKSGTVTSDQYEKNLSDYNAGLSRFDSDKAAYARIPSPTQEQYSKIETSFQGLQTEKAALDSQRQNIQNPPSIFETIGKVYEGANKGLAPYTTDITGLGRMAEAAPPVNLANYGDTTGTYYSDAINVAKGTYVGLTQHPLDIVAGYAGGEVLGIGEYAGKYAIAKAAMSDAPVVGTVGRALSTPLAADAFAVGKTIVGAYILGAATGEILSKPTAEGRGESIGRTALQFGGFGAGYSSPGFAEPFNDYAGKGFFSGHQQMGPLERVSYETRVELMARSQPTEEQATLIRVAGQLGGSSARFNEAPIKAEPNFEEASAIGTDYGTLIKGVAADKSNPTITKGSMVVASQYPESTVAEAGIRQAHDWDALTFDVGKKFETIATSSREPANAVPAPRQFATAEDVMASGIADLRPIPKPYPGFEPSVAPDVRPADSAPVTLMERIIGNPFERIAGPRGTSEVLIAGKTKGYTGDTNNEAAQAQFGRKVGSALKDFAQDPIGQGYRGQKDFYDTVSEYTAQKITARKAGVDVTKGDWAADDAVINQAMKLNIRVGSDKGQTEGGKVINLGEWFAEKQAEVRGGGLPKENSPFLPKESPSPRGAVSRSIDMSPSGSINIAGRSAQSPGSPNNSPESPASPSRSTSSRSVATFTSEISLSPTPSDISPSRASAASSAASLRSPSISPSTFDSPSPSDVASPSPSGYRSQPSPARSYEPGTPFGTPLPSPRLPSPPSPSAAESPGSPTPPSPSKIPPPSFISTPWPIGIPGQGGSGGTGRRSRKRLEYFPIGLDISTFGTHPEANPFTNTAGQERYVPRDVGALSGGRARGRARMIPMPKPKKNIFMK
jgi:hypothetical protein